MSRFDEITRKMQDLGFTAYEAKAYVSLLQNNPVTRYQLGKNSGVPRSAIYSVIQKLEQIGAVNAQSTSPEKYVPLPSKKLFELLQRQFNNKVKIAQQSLKNLESTVIPDHLWNIIGYENMIMKLREMIQKAKKSIYLSIWHREYLLLKNDITEALNRGVQSIIFSFTNIESKGSQIFSYSLSENELEKIWAHKIILIADKKELLMGEADNKQQKKTAWTTNRALIDIATNHIILDITIFGQRMNRDVSAVASSMQNGETDYLGKLLKEKFPLLKF